MKIHLSQKLTSNYRVFLQRLGYSEHRYAGQTEPNFTKRLSGNRFPRVHVYVQRSDAGLSLNMHLDMQESRTHGSRHGGVYEHELLDSEAERIKKMADLEQESASGEQEETPPEKKKSLFRKLFG